MVPFSSFYCSSFQIQTLVVPVMWLPTQVLAERLVKSSNISPLEAKREVPNLRNTAGLPRLFAPHWQTSFNVRPFPTPNRRRKRKRKSCQVFPLGFVLFFFLLLCFFTPVSICPLFSSPFPSSTSSSLLPLCTSNMSFFVFCTYRPFFPIELPAPSTPLALPFPLKGLIMSRH